MLHRLVLTLGLVAALGACQAGGALDTALEGTFAGAYDYAALEVPLRLTPAGSVAVTVIDQRPYVVNGDEPPSFVGNLPGRYGNIVDAKTASGRPLAELVGEALARALERRGADVSALPLGHGTPGREALAALSATGAERLVIVRIGEWQTEARVRVSARWELEATVHDRAGELLGRRAIRGSETIGTTDIEEESGPLAVSALAARLARLLGDPAITGALGGA